MRRLIPLIILLLCLTSCGLFKKVTRNVSKHQESQSLEVKKDSAGTTVDKSHIVVKEKVDSLIIIPEHISTSEQFVNIDSLINSIINIKNDLFTVKLDYNKVTGVLKTTTTLHPHKVHIQVDKTTTIKKDVVTSSNVKEQTKSKLSRKDKTTEKVSIPDYSWILWIAGILFIAFIAFRFWKRKSAL